MYYIVVKELEEKTKELFYLWRYDEKKKLASYHSDPNDAIIFETKEAAEEYNRRIPKLIRGKVIPKTQKKKLT